MTQTRSWFHLSVKTVSRAAGRSAVAAAAYRIGERLTDERSQTVHDYTRRSGVETVFSTAPSNAPEWAHDPERLWNAAEQAERRKNSTLAREIELALPSQVSPAARREITAQLAHQLVDRYGVGVTAAIHEPSARGDARNFHTHLLFTTRQLDADGLGAKTRILDDRRSGPEEVTYLREYAAGLINEALAQAGSEHRVDHRSYEARGIDQEPTQHLGPTASSMEQRGAASERGDENRAIMAGNTARIDLDALVADLAALDASIDRRMREEFWPEDWFLDVRADTQERAGREAEHPAEIAHAETVPPPIDAFEAVRQETRQLAASDYRRVEVVEEPVETGRFHRLQRWWQHAVESFGEWRETLIDRYEAWRNPEASSDSTQGLAVGTQEPDHGAEGLGGAPGSDTASNGAPAPDADRGVPEL